MLFTIKLTQLNKAESVYLVPNAIEAMWNNNPYETTILLESGDTISVRESPEAITKIVQKAQQVLRKNHNNDTGA